MPEELGPVLATPGASQHNFAQPSARFGASDDVIPVVILNWNGENDTIECLLSIKESVPSGFVPVVVDNGSKRESLEKLKVECVRIFSKVLFLKSSEIYASRKLRPAELRALLDSHSLIFVESAENLGFAKGNNVGTRFAQIIGAEWVMYLNNDTVISVDTFWKLREFRDTHPIFLAITPEIREYERPTRILNCGGDLTYFGRHRYNLLGRDASEVRGAKFFEITFITGCALLFNYESTGLLTEDFFFGEEDYEFSLRMKEKRLKMACNREAVVRHKLGTTIKKSSQLGRIMVYCANRLINTRNYYSKARWNATRLLMYLYLPLLFAKSGIDPRRSISAIRQIHSFIARHDRVTQDEFLTLVTSKH